MTVFSREIAEENCVFKQIYRQVFGGQLGYIIISYGHHDINVSVEKRIEMEAKKNKNKKTWNLYV